MSLLSSTYSSASGLKAHSDAMSVVADNIANVNTVGFKGNRALFANVLAEQVGNASATQGAGQGSTLWVTQSVETQGSLVNTGRSTDLALQGAGYFVVKGTFSGQDSTYYTRNGSFSLDLNGYLVNADGLRVQGYGADGKGNILTAVQDIQVQVNASSPPSASSTAVLAGNLNSESTAPLTFDVTTPSTTSSFSTSVQIYDSLGRAHNVDIYFSASPPNTYSWNALANSAEITGSGSDAYYSIANGTLDFGTDGTLKSVTGNTATINFADATAAQAVTFNFGDPTDLGGTGLLGMTSYASSSTVTDVSQDGYSNGNLAGISVGDDGTINGTFTNGVQRSVGQLALATFADNGSLERLSHGLYSPTAGSGNPIVGQASVAGRGTISAGCLEQSTVDIAEEFINLMAYQRGFQANTRVVQTADSMSQELVNLIHR